jgi:transcriptional regulator with XRE-family HTH domain
MTSFKDFLEEQLLDAEFAGHYEEVSAEMDLALALVARREKLRLKQQDLAELTGIKQPMIARIEGGQMPSPKTLQRLARALEVGIVFTGEGVMVVPLTGSKTTTQHHPPKYHSGASVWAITTQKVAQQRQRIKGDISLLRRMSDVGKMSRSPIQKEKPNAGLEIAA